MEKIIFASTNKHKLSEISNLVKGLSISIISLEEIGWTEQIPEDYPTLEENARHKAITVYNKMKISCFSDDSGLEVDALNGQPGVHSARFSISEYPDISDKERDKYNVKLLLQKLENENNRKACFRTVICFVDNGIVYFFEGRINGTITREPIGENGFGYDPIFIPDGYSRTFAQMNQEQKNSISHRSLAIKEFVKFLENRSK
jgi:XTP/dITP diphosphohydrolase